MDPSVASALPVTFDKITFAYNVATPVSPASPEPLAKAAPPPLNNTSSTTTPVYTAGNTPLQPTALSAQNRQASTPATTVWTDSTFSPLQVVDPAKAFA